MHAKPMPDPRLPQPHHYALAAAVRDPDSALPPGVAPTRVELYRELVYNNIEDFLRTAFPVLHTITPPWLWEHRARTFLREYRCRSPLFNEIAREFVDFLVYAYRPRAEDPVFLNELAHYEWVELALSIAEDPAPVAGLHAVGDLLHEAPVLSPLAWALDYRFAVQYIGPDYQPGAAEATRHHLLAYRGPDDAVHFMALNPLSAELLRLLDENRGHSGAALLARIAADHPEIDPLQLTRGGLETLADWRQRGILLGTVAAKEVSHG